VLTAPDGAAAVALYAQHSEEIAVVLTDMRMPVMDGTATIHALRRINPNVKLIVATGSKEGAAEANAAGVPDHLFKPYTIETLLRTLHRVVRR
jgi:CheY-like chemotaxis protein